MNDHPVGWGAWGTGVNIQSHCVAFTTQFNSQRFLGAFAKLRKATIGFIRMEELDSHWTDFD
jgi:hypothetical protein